MDADQAKGETYEEEHVHGVYEQIASHFSSTRYKPWPIIERFLKELPDGAIGLDIGCGNGKYLSVNPNIFIIASDRSQNLATIAKSHAPSSVLVADLLHLPHPPHAFDFAISIAVVHHLSTPARRVEALESILQTLRPGGKALVTVWALEQESSRRGWSEGDDQDVMVPWVMRGSKKGATAQGGEVGGGGEDRVFNRYYHLFRKGELEGDVESAGGEVVEGGWERDNWWVVARPRVRV
ncbi:hypothetical protein B0A54_09322 [Friedmanniomyces endolithicus]|uniref:Methyltransferase type 11 domain-containing protein n=1 Tax=Friedmanniomyces endolithicus TaxID=329885 RepID=A0A4U0UWM5_9PEZI|nr:hypothetical protein B0A54_09322 [Friedmanniomyces endolithicus]